MVYGTASTVETLVYGTAKATTPAGVTSALQTATDYINAKLNIRVELTGDDLPVAFESIANQLAAGILQEQRDPRSESQRTIMGKQMLDDFRDDTTSSVRGESYHIRFVESD
jgi:hypothetical protein